MNGKCYCCKKEISNRSAKKHLLSCPERNIYVGHDSFMEDRDKFLLKISYKENKTDYYLYIDILAQSDLRTLDTFLKDIWLGYDNSSSCFHINGHEYPSTCPAFDGLDIFGLFTIGNIFNYTFTLQDNSKICLELEVIDLFLTNSNCKKVELLARSNLNSPRESLDSYKCIRENEEKYLPTTFKKPIAKLIRPTFNTEPNISLSPDNKAVIISDIFTSKEDDTREKINISDGDLDNSDTIDLTIDGSDIDFLKGLDETYPITDEMFENAERSIEKAITCNTSMSLEKFLNEETELNLIDFLDILSIDYNEAKKKEELIAILLENYPKVLPTLLKDMTYEAFKKINKFIHNDGFIELSKCNDSLLLKDLGLIFICSNEADLGFYMPKELIDIFNSISINISTLKKNSYIVSLYKGALYYYGALSIDTFLDILPEDVDVDIDNLEDVIALESGLSTSYIYNGTIGFSSLLMDIIQLENIEKLQSEDNADFKKCTEEELLNMSDNETIFKEPHYMDFMNKLTDYFEIPYADLEELLVVLFAIYQAESSESLDEFILAQIDYDEFIKTDITTSLHSLCDSMPRWDLLGYSPFEKKPVSMVDQIISNRNEPCPCGSGKKYNECCGSKVIKLF